MPRGKKPTPEQIALQSAYLTFTNFLSDGSNPEAHQLLLLLENHYTTFSRKSPLVAELINRFSPLQPHRSPQDLLNDYLSFFGRLPKDGSWEPVRAAIDKRAEGLKAMAEARRKFVARISLNPRSLSAATRKDLLCGSSMPRIEVVPAVQMPYPPADHWLIENDEIDALWRDHLLHGKQPDPCLRRKPIHRVELDKLDHDLGPDDSALFVDKDSGEIVMMVARNFCPDQQTIEWATKVVLDQTSSRRNIRKEDGGSISIVRWSAGSRSAPRFDWVSNLVGKDAKDRASELEYEGSSLFALFWNLCRASLPDAIIDDIEDFVSRNKMPCMDHGAAAGGSEGHYTVNVGGEKIVFSGAQLAPPTGVFAINYARASHWEQQPHKYAISWTVARKGGIADGGHFYNCALRTRVQGVPNTLVVWFPRQLHATSAQKVDLHHKKPAMMQCGLSIVTSSRLEKIYQQSNFDDMTEEEVLKLLFAIDEYLDTEEEGN